MPPAALIDLDQDPPVPAKPRRVPVDRGWIVGAVILILAGTLLTGATAPPAGPMIQLANLPPGQGPTVVSSSAAYLAGSAGFRGILGYALPGGGLRWRLAVPRPVLDLRLLTGAGMLFATTEERDGGSRVLAVDVRTGRQLWSKPGAMVIDAPPAGQAVLERTVLPGALEVSLLRARTGREYWSRQFVAGSEVSTQDDFGGATADPARSGGGLMLVTAPDGDAQLIAESTGAVLVRGQLGSLVGNVVLTPGPSGGVPRPVPELAPTRLLGDRLLVQRRPDAGPGSLTAFDIATLTERWSVSGDLLGLPFSCGASLCLGGAGGLRALDPVTGAVRWSARRWEYATPLNQGRLLGYAIGGEDGTLGVLDAGTGRTVRDLGPGWTQVYASPAGPTLVGHQDSSRPDRYWLARLDTGPTGVHPLGYLTGVNAPTCEVTADLLDCRTGDGRLHVWRFPSA